MRNRNDLTAYYDLANCCNDDIFFIAKLLHFVKTPPSKPILHSLENLNVRKYENDFNILLDNLHTQSIKDLYLIYKSIN